MATPIAESSSSEAVRVYVLHCIDECFDTDDGWRGIRAIIISVHSERRNDWDEISDLDDEELERVERQREREDRRRQSEEAERRQLEAIEAAREEVPPAPANAYSPEDDRD